MGEHADDLIEREIRSTGQRMARDHMRELHNRTEEARRAAGREECARNLAVHEAREASIAAVIEAGNASPVLIKVGLELVRVHKAVHAHRKGTTSRVGIWYPNDKNPIVGAGRIQSSTPEAWFEAVAAYERRGQVRAAADIARADREAVHRAR